MQEHGLTGLLVFVKTTNANYPSNLRLLETSTHWKNFLEHLIHTYVANCELDATVLYQALLSLHKMVNEKKKQPSIMFELIVAACDKMRLFSHFSRNRMYSVANCNNKIAKERKFKTTSQCGELCENIIKLLLTLNLWFIFARYTKSVRRVTISQNISWTTKWIHDMENIFLATISV